MMVPKLGGRNTQDVRLGITDKGTLTYLCPMNPGANVDIRLS